MLRYLKISYRFTMLMAIAFIFLMGCTPTTRITGSWKSPEATKTYNSLVVAALTDNVMARQKVENDMVMQLQQRGVQATRSIDIFPPTSGTQNGPEVNALLDKIKSNNHDAILTVALVDEKTQTRYVPGNYGYRPVTRYAWYGNFRGYYTHWYPILYEPGYYAEDKIYYLETNLYDVSTDNLLWSAQSQSYSPGSLRKASENLAEITVNKIAEDKLIR